MPVTTRTSFHLSADDLTLARGGRTLITDLSFRLSAGSRLAVVGENGRGKTTLLHTLVGRIRPDAGRITLSGSVDLVEQDLEFGELDTVGTLVGAAVAPSHEALVELDAAAAGLAEDTATSADRYAVALETAEALDAWDTDRRVDVALERLGAVTDRSRPLRELSVGQRYRVRLACLLGAVQDLLLLDEPTNHLDASGLDYLTEAVRGHPGGVAVVSHDRTFLADVATHVLDLDPGKDGRTHVYGGGFAGWVEARRRELETWEQEYAAQVDERRRLRESLSEAQNRLSTGWRPDKGTGKHQRQSRAPGVVAQVKRRTQELEAARITAPVPPLSLRMPALASDPGRTYLTLENVEVHGRLGTPVSLNVRGGDKILVTGPNGAGKSTLLDVACGLLEPDSGTAAIGSGARIARVGQENPNWDSSRSAHAVFESHVARLVSAGVLPAGDAVSLDSLGLITAEARAESVGSLSLGQQRRLELAMRLAGRPHVLVLDEPTNHVSMQLVAELTEALRTTGAAVLVATHDRKMIDDLQNFARVEMRGEGVLLSPSSSS